MKKIKELKHEDFGSVKCITIEFENSEIFIENEQAIFWLDTINKALVNDQLHNGASSKIGETLITHFKK
jgi:hypothetical protein